MSGSRSAKAASGVKFSAELYWDVSRNEPDFYQCAKQVNSFHLVENMVMEK